MFQKVFQCYFFYHITGRIERYLFNPNLIFWNKKVNLIYHKPYELEEPKLLNPYLFNYKERLKDTKPTLNITRAENNHFKSNPEICSFKKFA